ncbi:ligase-associated DNA damage response endonuclease PdeM [Tianweitania sp. Rool2]|uniref:Ligase-associated DNA damage response endonuclease PdeM n=2 Tax=Oryzicola mucosus TaxID=2767425 RepID=A0A8J6PQP9_9HYPH|nr:ligase-associated DNA damage response endonuclease PdeM [Oryzicola mucosus]
MNVAARDMSPGSSQADAIVVAGQRAVCDLRGALYFRDLGLLAVSDLHLEKGSSFARRGALLPPYDTAVTLQRLEAVIADYRPRIVVSLGDSFHDGQGAARLHEIFRAGLETMMAGRDWYWVAGNHDPEAPADLPGETVRELAVAGLVFRHEPARKGGEGEIAGHLHPCARIVQRGRSVRRRCFASDGLRLIMPAFGAFTGSLNVLDKAYAGLFRREALMAYMLGQARVYPIAGSLLRA